MNIPIINISSQEDFLKKIRGRSAEVQKDVSVVVSEIIENVKQNGDKALLEYTHKFDKVKLSSLEIDKS